jgi:hypothetical protein
MLVCFFRRIFDFWSNRMLRFVETKDTELCTFESSSRVCVAPVQASRSDDDGDADYVPWSNVVQAFVATETAYSCPICLENPSPVTMNDAKRAS